MLEELKADKIAIGARRDRTDLKGLSQEGTMNAVIRFIGFTGVEKRPTEDTNKCASWDIDRLDWVGDGMC